MNIKRDIAAGDPDVTAAEKPQLAIDNSRKNHATKKPSAKIEAWKDGRASIRLSKPIETLQGRREVLELVEPTAGVMIDIGVPYIQHAENIGPDGRPGGYSFEYNAAKMSQYMVQMIEGVDENILRSLSLRDFKDIFDLIVAVVEAEEAGNS